MPKRFTTLTDEEIVNAIAAVDEYGCKPERRPMLRALFTLLANTGLRITEAITLQWRAIDFDLGEVTVRTLKQPGRPAKGRKADVAEDTIPLDTHTIQSLLAWREVSPQTAPADRIFPLSRHVTYNVFQRLQHYACIRPVKLHALRHSAVTRWLEATGDLAFAQAMARHRSVTSTAVYVHATKVKEKFQGVPKIAPPPVAGGPRRPSTPRPKPPALALASVAAAPQQTPTAMPEAPDANAFLAALARALVNLAKPQTNGNEVEVGHRPAGA